MKKAWCLIIAAAIITSSASFAFADEPAAEITEAAAVESVQAEANEAEGTTIDDQIIAVDDAEESPADSNEDADLMASIDGYSFEYDYSASKERERVVKVKYDKSYFTKGICSFNAEISIPSAYVESVSQTSRLSGFNITESYENGIYKVSGTCGQDKIPVDGCVFTMVITLNQNILNPFTISLTGNSSLADSTGTSQSLANGGLNPVSLEIPRNISDEGFSGTDGTVTYSYSNEVLTIGGNGTMTDYSQGEAPWYKEAQATGFLDRIKTIVFKNDNLQNISKNAFYGFTNVQQVNLSSNIATIGESAFEGCSSLQTVEIPTNSKAGIGNYAFKNCSSLRNIIVPDGVTVIGRGAFEGCTSLGSMSIPFVGSQNGRGNNEDTFSYIFNGNVPSSLSTVSVTNESSLPDNAFKGCSNISNIFVNDAVSSIGASAFEGCSSLGSFNIPASTSKLMDNVFKGCSSLRTVDGMDHIAEIGASAFEDCRSLGSILISSNVKYLNNNTFKNCSSLTAIEIPDSVTDIGENVLTGCTSLVDMKIPFVGANVNPGSKVMTSEGILGYFFGSNNSGVPASLTKVEVSNSSRNSYIPPEAFKDCGNIKDIVIHGGRVVCDFAFANCRNLRYLYIPQSVSTIGVNILKDCANINTIVVPFIGTDRNDRNTPTSVFGSFFGFDDSDPLGTKQYYDSAQNFHFYSIPDTLKSVTVINQTNIPTGAFMECYSIEQISFLSGANLNDYAFYHCTSLKDVTLPNDMQNIGTQAFAECESLTKINVPNKVKEIGSNAFYGCRALTDVTMPDSVTTIASDVFNGTNIASGDAELLANSDLVITCTEGSEAYKYAQANGIKTNVVSKAEMDKIQSIGVSLIKNSTDEHSVDVNIPSGVSGTAYVGLYDTNGRLVSAQLENVATGNKGASYHFVFNKEDSEGTATAKAMILSTKMEPQSNEPAVDTVK